MWDWIIWAKHLTTLSVQCISFFFFIVKCLEYGSQLCCVCKRFVLDVIIQSSVGLREVLLVVRDDFCSFICQFNDDVGVMGKS